VEKARSLIEAEANLDELDDGFGQSHRASVSQDSPSAQGARGTGLSSAGFSSREHEAGSRESGVGHPSGFAPASATQSGFSPAGVQPRPVSTTESGVFSGVPGGTVSGDRLVDSLQSALGAASRNEAGLGSLQRAIRDASRAFTASRHAQEALTEDLRVMYRGLNELMSEKAAVERYAALLTQERDAALDAAEEARREAKRDREFLIREQDRFIQLLLEEHEAELLQVRRALSQQKAGAELATVPGLAPPPAPSLAALPMEPGPVAASEVRRSLVGGPEDAAPRLSGAALARQALANSVSAYGVAPSGVLANSGVLGSNSGVLGNSAGHAGADNPVADNAGINSFGGSGVHELARVVPLPSDSSPGVGPEARAEDERLDERSPSYPPAPAVLDLDALAAEVDGNSERPPPIRRMGVAEPKIHLKPARVPTQLFDTLVSPTGEPDTKRKG
jgi:hypothetical protein